MAISFYERPILNSPYRAPEWHQHWRHYNLSGAKPFFFQVEAVETIIWLTELAPGRDPNGE